jgi:hypothetical protein
VEDVQDVWAFALTNQKVKNAVTFTIDDDETQEKKN